jgi:hypothetical protein
MCRLGSPSFSKSSPVTTTRALHQGLDTLLTALLDSGLALEINGLAVDTRRVTWQPRQSAGPFLGYRQHATVEQYLLWLANGDYCAVLLDGSLLQLTYDVDAGQVSGHRLAYIPCPYELDQDLLDEGFSIEELVRFYEASPTDAVALRSPVRFDYDPSAAKPGHPASHLTINSPPAVSHASPLYTWGGSSISSSGTSIRISTATTRSCSLRLSLTSAPQSSPTTTERPLTSLGPPPRRPAEPPTRPSRGLLAARPHRRAAAAVSGKAG